MSEEKFQNYQKVKMPIPEYQYAWPLYGSGLTNLGKDGKPVRRSIPDYGPDELLVRIDTVSLCYTDLKEVDQGENHPRLKDRDLKEDPIVPGHELCMTIVAVGTALKDEYKVGQRFTMQPDVWVDGKSTPFCFGMDGAYRQYAAIDQRILHGDAGNYLIPVPDDMTYAAAAITEPWACVEAAYRMSYRTTFRADGKVLFLGADNSRTDYTLDLAWLNTSKPRTIYGCGLPEVLRSHLASICQNVGIEYADLSEENIMESNIVFDDILLLDDAIGKIAMFDEKMAKGAVIGLFVNQSTVKNIEIDLGRLHYDDLLYIGTEKLEISEAYQRTPARVEFQQDGVAWILGAGGPMGRMHLQRAIESPTGPRTIIASEVSEVRLQAIRDFFGQLAIDNKKHLIAINPIADKEKFSTIMNEITASGGVDDVEVMVTIPGIIVDTCPYLGNAGVINIFAGMKRGVKMPIDPMLIAGEKQIRLVGHSGSDLQDQKAVVKRCISKDLNTDLSVAAIGGLNQIAEGIQAMSDSIYPGKIVIYPQLLDFPLTGLPDLHKVLPDVAAKLGDKDTWNGSVEQAFLEHALS